MGGIAGDTGDISFHNCYNNAVITSVQAAGGITASCVGDMTHCYNSGQVRSMFGLAGSLTFDYVFGTMTSCFWDQESSGLQVAYSTSSFGVTVVNSEAKTTAQMQNINTYLSAGWDFVGETINGPNDIWYMPEDGGYPLLWWQPEPVAPEVSAAIDDFETGDFSSFDWKRSGDASWYITSVESNSGRYSAQAGSIADDEQTTLRLTRGGSGGEITFSVKVSSEQGFDELIFYIDGDEKGIWSGENDWVQVSFPVTAGSHTFEWRYEKDGSSEEDDTA